MEYPNHKYFRISYVCIICTNILEYHMISKSQILCQGYSVDVLFQSARGPCRLKCLAAPSGPGCHGPLRTILCHCNAQLLSLSHRQAPRRGLPRPNCHIHWLISYTLLPFLPDSSAASASPCGNLALRCWRCWCGMVGV